MNDDKKFGALIVGGVLLILVIIGMFQGKTSPSSIRPAGMSEAEYNYANGRMRREGMNSKQADEATRAVWQYEQARRAREGR